MSENDESPESSAHFWDNIEVETSDNTHEAISDDDEFEDASAEVGQQEEMLDLSQALKEVNIAINLFFNNEFIEAKKLCQQRSSTSMYHALGVSTIQFLEAVMTFQAADISQAISSIRNSMRICNRCRKKRNIVSSFGQMMGLSNVTFTDDELHAEVIFAELNLFHAFLTFIQDENLISFIKGALKIRLGYQTYNYCQQLLNGAAISKNKHVDDFAGAIKLGCGTFNIGLSLLPPRILALLKWIGFTSNKQLGLKQISEGFAGQHIRSTLISLYILAYHLFISPFVGALDFDLVYSDQVLKKMLQKFPNGVYFHFFAGRMEEFRGDYSKAIEYLKKASSLQTEWKQFSHFCYWELMWCNVIILDWKGAEKYATLLREENNWSKCVYAYLQAVFLYMTDEAKTEDNVNKIREFMRSVPGLRQRIAGKSIPMEKFVARKSRKFFEQGEFLLLPAHEMLNLWNGLQVLKNNSQVCQRHLDLVEAEQAKLEVKKAQQPQQVATSRRSSSPRRTTSTAGHPTTAFYYYDDYCLLQELKGQCLRYGNKASLAELCYVDVKENYKGIKKDHYIAPVAVSDLSAMLIEQERFQEATKHLKYARKTYSHYSMESRIHFRLHAAETRIKELTKTK